MKLTNESTGKRPGTALSWLGLVMTLGIVYGDIGTSPLYVMKTIMRDTPQPDTTFIIGVLSCIIWTLTLQTTVKYVAVALRADNKGEGGILALYTLVRKLRHKWLYAIAIIGASTLIADGVITPSITVVTAIEGLLVLHPDTAVIPISIGIIAALFFMQQFGTKFIGRFFGPVMLGWFLMIGIMGVVRLPEYWSVLQAFNPWHAIRLLCTSPEWFLIMGAVFLCTTGAEALYADLGHCGINNIRVSWIFVKSMLILNYLGQGAWMMTHPQLLTPGTNPFFAIMPGWFLLPGIAMATAAAVIASQALISGSFTLFSEAMNLGFWPNQKIKFPTNVKGQLYIPFINMAMFIGCVLIILVFQSSDRIEAAYGLSITVTMLMTTVLLGFYLHSKRTAAWTVVPFVCIFIGIEAIFLTANLFKFFHGGWMTVLIAGVVAGIMYVWYNSGKIRRRNLEFVQIDTALPIINAIKSDASIAKFASNLVYVSRQGGPGEVERKVIYSIINKQPKRADHYWLLHVDITDEPDTLSYTYTTLTPGSVFRIDLRMGFRVRPLISVYFRQIVEDLVKEKRVDLCSGYPSLHRFGIPGDFRFVVIRRIYTPGTLISRRYNLIMNLSSVIRRIATTDIKALGLDTSNVTTESVPLIVKPTNVRRVERAE